MTKQFSLRTLLLAAVVVSTSMAVFGPWGLAVAAFVLFKCGPYKILHSRGPPWPAYTGNKPIDLAPLRLRLS